MGQACQLQCLSVVTMETDAFPANCGCLRDVFSALSICSRFLIFLKKKKKSCMVKVQGLILSDIIRMPKGLNFMSFSVSLKAHSLFRERKTLCHLSNLRHARWQPFSQALCCLIFSFRGCFFLAQQVVRRMWSNFIDLKSGWFILPISWHPASVSITLATLETDWNIMALPVKRNKLSPVKVRFFKGLT